jgi:hypothetical protein
MTSFSFPFFPFFSFLLTYQWVPVHLS